MKPRRLSTWLRLSLMGLGLAAAGGFVSSLVSASQCEMAVAERIARELETRNVWILSGENLRDAERILRRSKFHVRQCKRTGDDFDCFPWASVGKAKVLGPFLVDVKWALVGAPLSGEGGSTRFLALFGIVFPVWNRIGWVT